MLDLRYEGIRVSLIMPGSVDTGFGDRPAGEKEGWALTSEDVSRAVLDLLRYPGNALPSRVELRPSQPPRNQVIGGVPEVMSDDFRIEKDSLGEVRVPRGALWCPDPEGRGELPHQRPTVSPAFIQALGLVKKSAALTNGELGELDPEDGSGHRRGGREVEEGKWDGEFVVDVYQTGSGTSTNMNANEVIARRADQILVAGSARCTPTIM